MRHILTSVFLVVLLFPALAFGEEVTLDDLVERDGIHYKKFSTVPFTGKVTGKTQGSFRNGKEEGLWVGYHDNGQLWYKGTYKDGKSEGPWVSYHDNGQLSLKGIYKDGERDGPWVRYHDNGQLWQKGEFKDGKMDGPWVEYYKNGQIYSEKTYKDGVKVSD